MSNFNETVSVFDEVIEKTVKELIYTKTINVQYAKQWYTQELAELREKRNEAARIANILNEQQSWTDYKQKRNVYNRRLQQVHSDHIKNTISNYKKDQKKLWKELKKLNCNNSDCPECIDFNC